jgi:hypothetical protein
MDLPISSHFMQDTSEMNNYTFEILFWQYFV